ncbi:MAG: magnesium/cobalt transporter CorA [Candidatus Thorarchaeota archaeon]
MINDDVSEKVGLPPGTVVHTGPERTEEVTINIMEFLDGQMREYVADSIDDCSPPADPRATKWVHVNGVHDVEIVKRVCGYYDVHPLVVEDIPSVGQRPKIDTMDTGTYIVLRSFSIKPGHESISSEQVSIVFGRGFILTFQESAEDLFAPIREQARVQRSVLRSKKSDYLTYAVMDLIIDRYFVVLERIGDLIENLEDDLIARGSAEMLNRIYRLKRSLQALRRFVWPLREVSLKLQREGSKYVHEETYIYFRDLYDHIIRVTDHVETYRESITGMLDIYLSSISNQMNEVMQFLTIVSTIFIPLTLVTSLYGMNWPWVPGLDLPILVMSFLMSFVLLIVFKLRRWV